MNTTQHSTSWVTWAGAFAAALTGAALGIFVVLPLGLVVDGSVIVPLALFEGALLAAVYIVSGFTSR